VALLDLPGVAITEITQDVFHFCIAKHLGRFHLRRARQNHLSFSPTCCEESFKKVFEKGIRDRDHIPEVFQRSACWTRHTSREETVEIVWAYMSAKSSSSIVDQGLAERGIKFSKGPVSDSTRSTGIGPFANPLSQVSQAPWAVPSKSRLLFVLSVTLQTSPGAKNSSHSLWRATELFPQFAIRVLQVVSAVSSSSQPKTRRVGRFLAWLLSEMSNVDVPVLRLAVRGDEQQFMEPPCGPVVLCSRTPAF